MTPVKINNKPLYRIFDPGSFDASWTEDEIISHSIDKKMFPTEVHLTSETYSRDAKRTADYELEDLVIVNRKAKPEFTWDLIPYEYIKNLMEELDYHYDFKDSQDVIIPEDAPTIAVTFYDLVGERTINAYLGQTIEGTLIEYDGVLYWQDFRIAFPER